MSSQDSSTSSSVDSISEYNTFPLALFPHIDAVPALSRYVVQMTQIFGPVAPLALGFIESCNSDAYRSTYIPVPSQKQSQEDFDPLNTELGHIESGFRKLISDIGHLRSNYLFSNSQNFLNLQNPRHTSGPTLELEKLLYKITSGHDFDAFAFHKATHGAPLYVLSMHLMHIHGFIAPQTHIPSYNSASLAIDGPTKGYGVFPLDKLSKFFAEIEANYLPYTYHNQMHAADVLQLAHLIFISKYTRFYGEPEYLANEQSHNSRLSTIIDINSQSRKLETALEAHVSPYTYTRLELLALLIAAAIHDVGHTGSNNAFQIKTSSPLALLYNDQNILENNHLATAFSILKKPECDFMSHLVDSERNLLRSMVIQLVLATDLADHRRHIDNAKSVVESLEKAKVETNQFAPEASDRLALLKIVLKCSDVGHPARPTPVHIQWSNSIQSEFFAQGDQERSLGFTVVGPTDRYGDSLPKSQIGFINFLVKPIYTILNHPIITPPRYVLSNELETYLHDNDISDEANVYKTTTPNESNQVEILAPWIYYLTANLKYWSQLEKQSSQ